MKRLEQRLSRIDLNLLVSLSVLLSERSVTKAAEILFVTQPAMSKTLQKLRTLFDDPILYRSPEGMLPTPKALELAQKLPRLLTEFDQLLSKAEFEPKECDKSFVISLPSVFCEAILVPLVERLKKIAPKVSLMDIPIEAEPTTSLELSKYDFAFHVINPDSKFITNTSLCYLTPNIFVRHGHPLTKLNRAVTSNDMREFEFIDYQVGVNEEKAFKSPTEKLEKALGFSPKIAQKCSHFSFLKELLANNDYLFISPSFLAKSPQFSKYFTDIFCINLPRHDQYELQLLEAPHVKYGEAEQWIKAELINTFKSVMNSTKQ